MTWLFVAGGEWPCGRRVHVATVWRLARNGFAFRLRDHASKAEERSSTSTRLSHFAARARLMLKIRRTETLIAYRISGPAKTCEANA